MSYSAGWKSGRWSAICDVCGFRFHSDRLQKRWDGLMVCKKDYETRHPQDLIKINPDTVTPPWTRPEPPDVHLFFCFLWALSSYAGLAEAGCAKAGSNLFSYTFLKELKAG